jgi:addiction module HigA family antidote
MRRIFDDTGSPGYEIGVKENPMPDLNEIARWTVRPVTPGDYLRRLLAYLGLTQEELAAAIDTSRFTISQIVSGKRTVTPAMALKLSKVTGTTIDIWLNLQRDVDLFDAYADHCDVLSGIEPLRESTSVTILPVGSDLEMLSHRVVGEAFPPLERSAADIRRNHIGSSSRLQVAVFAPDALEQVASLAARIGVPVYHFGFETAAIVIDDEADSADQMLRTSFSDIPTGFDYRQFQGKFGIRMTISGGIATTDTGLDILPAAVEAAELQRNLSHYRSGAAEHLWSRTFRGR